MKKKVLPQALPQEDSNHKVRKLGVGAANLFINLLSKLIAIPAFIWVYRMLPNGQWPFYLDKLLLFLLIFVVTQILLRLLRKAILVAAVLALTYLLYGSLTHHYGFRSLYKDYAAMVYAAVYDPVPAKINLSGLKPFPNERPIRRAIDYTSPAVRDFALFSINKHFRDYQQPQNQYRTLIQCFAIFKEINGRWNYVNDPKSRDYYARASESVRYLSGDCDDHSTLMAACVKAVGGTPRLILTTKHIYPELYIGDLHDLEHINLLIRDELFSNEIRKKRINFHRDQDGKVWINLDYTATYPGGEFLSEKVLGILVP